MHTRIVYDARKAARTIHAEAKKEISTHMNYNNVMSLFMSDIWNGLYETQSINNSFYRKQSQT